jgi:hypothetical protein
MNLDYILSLNLTPNQYYVLTCIKKRRQPDKRINLFLELRGLKSAEYLTEDGILTSKAEKLFEEVNESKESKDEYTSFVESFRDCFPPIKLGSGKYFRCPIQDLTKRLKQFQSKYNYSQEVILAAAKKYVQNEESQGFKFTRTSAYFIHKEGYGSELAQYCDAVLNGEQTEENNDYLGSQII